MHNYKPNQKVRIAPVLLSFDADLPEHMIADYVSDLLTEYGMCGDNPLLLDWRYANEDGCQDRIVQLSADPEEGEAFEKNDILFDEQLAKDIKNSFTAARQIYTLANEIILTLSAEQNQKEFSKLPPVWKEIVRNWTAKLKRIESITNRSPDPHVGGIVVE